MTEPDTQAEPRNTQDNARVAVLLPTYNSAKFIAAQLRSLANNRRRFTLHWMDDGSTDATVEEVRACARRLSIDLHEIAGPGRLGVPAAFFHLLENVEADVYLFCDHDDIWEEGKIDSAVSAVLQCGESPFFCFSEPKLFIDGSSMAPRRYFDVIGIDAATATDPTRALVFNPAVGNTVAINRALREVYVQHVQAAHRGAAMHDWWIYLLALATGKAQLLDRCPTTLYRQHAANTLGVRMTPHLRLLGEAWSRQKNFRRTIARQAQAFLSISDALGSNRSLDMLVQSAQLLRGLGERQSPTSLLRMVQRRSTPVGTLRSAFFLTGCLLSNAR